MVALSQIQELAGRIAQEFDPDRIILFGSHAYGSPHGDSDVDLLVIMDHDGSSFDKSVEIFSAVRPTFMADISVRAPDDVTRRYAQFDPLIREALDRGRVLYERNR